MKSPMIAPKPLSQVTNEEWARAYAGLKLYVNLRLNYVQRFGLSIEDIAHDAILHTLQGKRRWPVIDPETGEAKREIDFLTFLCGVARSLASHGIEKEKRMVSLTGLLDNDSDGRTDSDQRLLPDQRGELRVEANQEDKIAYDEYRNALLSAARAHEQVLRKPKRVTGWLEPKMREIARALGADTKRARYLMKLLRGGYCNGKEDE
jgi:hypothetical protein